MTRHRIIIDCDPGRDDALAIALALASPEEIELIGITAVAGNVALELTERNARFICELCGHGEVEVYPGASRPLVREPLAGRETHGKMGLEGLEVREPTARRRDRHAVDFITETLKAAGENEITLVAIAPLTNLAMVFAEDPELLPRVGRIVVMGGASRTGGNITPAAEFNTFADPHAAATVYACGRPITVMSLDVTYQVLSHLDHAKRLSDTGGEAARALANLMRPFDRRREPLFGPGRIPLHDPCTIAWLLQPELFETKTVNVAVETEGSHTLGATVVDWWGVTDRAPNADWAVGVDAEAVLELLIERIGRL